MKSATKRGRCLFCKAKFQHSGKGRKPDYCSASHRQRAYEVRRERRRKSSPIYALTMDIGTTRLRTMIRKEIIKALQDYDIIPAPQKREPPLKLIRPKKDD